MLIQKPKKMINFRASEELAQILREEAVRTHRSVSSFVRAILEMVLLPDPNEVDTNKQA
jgi:uncharacterized protein (DUF1778 family)